MSTGGFLGMPGAVGRGAPESADRRPGSRNKMSTGFTIKPATWFSYFLGVLLLAGIYLTSWHSYLLFHSVVETFSILVSFSIFLFAWNTLSFSRERYLIVLGIAYLFVGGFDFIHMLAYKGMGVLFIDGANYATQAWICARYVESLSLLAVPFLFHRNVDCRLVLLIYSVVFSALVLLVFVFHRFPVCFIEGQGLTPFKVISEYIICAILGGAAAAIYRQRRTVDPVMFRFLLASIGFTVASEIAFTNYVSVYGRANMVGHLLKIVSFYLIYRAIVAHGLLAPYRSMFRELTAKKNELENYSRSLESRVAERTRELEKSNRELRFLSAQLVTAEEKERKRIARDLHDSIGQSLSAIKLSLENALSRLGPDERSALERIVFMIRTAVSEVRRIIMDIRPSVLDCGIMATIESMRRDFAGLYPDIRVETRLSADEGRIPEDVKMIIFRLLQEALNNIGKHSGARHVNIVLAHDNGRIRFEVTDDGRGFDLQRAVGDQGRNGFGLTSMRERTELSGGSFSIRTRPGAGTSIRAAWTARPPADRTAAK